MNQQASPKSSPLRNVKEVIAISSCKGGVGKSTVAAQMAAELARQGFKVGLVDADLHGPSVPSLFNLKGVKVTSNEFKQFVPIDHFGLKIMSFGFLLGDGPAIFRGPIVSRYIQQILLNTDWGELDYLLIDMPPGTGDVQLTITQSLRLSGAVIVTTPQTLSLIDVARGILMFEKVSVPILGVIQNMAYFNCDKCQEQYFIFGKKSAQELTSRFGVPTIAEIPITSTMTQTISKDEASHQVISLAVDALIKALENKQTQIVPKIECDETKLRLHWEGQEVIEVSHRELRLSCRCALCANELTGEVMIKEEEIPEDIHPKAIIPLGNYALGIEWSDGHTSGIYPYENIKALACAK